MFGPFGQVYQTCLAHACEMRYLIHLYPQVLTQVLTEIKTNTEKLVLEVNSLKVNYNELQDNLASAKAQVDILVEENKFLTSKVKSLVKVGRQIEIRNKVERYKFMCLSAY